MDQKCLSCTKGTDLPEASLPLGGGWQPGRRPSLLACRGVLHVSQATAAARRLSRGHLRPLPGTCASPAPQKAEALLEFACRGLH